MATSQRKEDAAVQDERASDQKEGEEGDAVRERGSIEVRRSLQSWSLQKQAHLELIKSIPSCELVLKLSLCQASPSATSYLAPYEAAPEDCVLPGEYIIRLRDGLFIDFCVRHHCSMLNFNRLLNCRAHK
jgi:hypothetical protein